MNSSKFNEIIKTRIQKCMDVLGVKSGEYATDDRLHNFKVAAELQNCTPVAALAGMMAKHTVSVYDLTRKHENGEEISPAMWDEKIGDSINYLLLLTAAIEEERENGSCR